MNPGDSSTANALLLRVSDGAVDPAFAPQPAALCCSQVADISVNAQGIHVQTGGCAVATHPQPCDGRLVTIRPDGTVDGETPSPNRTPQRHGLIADESGGAYVGLFTDDRSSRDHGVFGVARVGSDSKKDRSFGRSGVARAFPKRCLGFVGDVRHDSDGRVVVVGGGCGSALVVRMLVSPGPHDADADGVRDKADECTLFYSASRRGCPLLTRSVEVTTDRGGRVRGLVRSRSSYCSNGTRVTIRRPNGIRVRRTRSAMDGSEKWSLGRPLRSGAYIAVAQGGAASARQGIPGAVVRCRPARRKFEVRRAASPYSP